MDGDDEIEQDMYERLLGNAKKYSADISHCGYQMHFADGRVHYFHNTGVREQHDKVSALRELLSGVKIEPGLCNKLYRREVFLGLDMPVDIRINEDLLMNYYLFANATSSVFEDLCPYHYIVRNGSASRAKWNPHKIYDPILVKEIIRQAAGDELRRDAQCAYLNTCINTYNSLLSSGNTYIADRRKVRRLLVAERTTFSLLGRRRNIMARLIVGMPLLYKPVYLFYSRFLQDNPYS